MSSIRMKRKVCAEVGIKSINIDLLRDVSEENVMDVVLDLNVDLNLWKLLACESFL